MNTFKFIKLVKNRKEPIKNECFKDTKELINIDTNLYNIGLMAGSNNLIILDIDDKDGGLIEWDNYLEEHFEPYTMKQRTLGGGFHYLFKHHDETYTEEENELINQLKNKSKYRNKGIDIRKNNGYILFQPSKINKETYKTHYGGGVIYPKYEEYKVMNDVKPNKMPLKLIKWLLEFESKEKEAINNNLILIEDVDELKTLLYKFDNVNSKLWFNITTAIKNLLHEYNNLDEDEIKLIWKKWSKEQNGYNKQENLKIWDAITSNININFIISQFNKTANEENKIELLESFKPLDKLIKPDDISMITMNNKYIYDEQHEGEQFNKDIFDKYETIIIKSTTGTGKTSNTARHVETYMKAHEEYKFMSIIDRISMSHQHLNTFKNINIVSYKNDKKNIEDDNIIICLNSLLMYSKYNGDFFKNYIVYIDEITSILNSLTHNDTLNNTLKGVYIVLMKIINNAHKVIVSDATINNNTFTFLNKRTNKIFIDNIYKKYEGVKVYKMNDENEFLNKMKDHIEKNKYFLFGGDSKNIITKYFKNDIKKDNIILISSDNPIEIIDATEQFKNKFVFYTPSITTGVDFNSTTPQDVFLYINGRTLTPEASFQQMSRTRNINKVYVFISENKSTPASYNTIEETKEHFKNISTSHTKISKLCLNEINDEYIFNENAFFNIFCYNEYIIDTYKTNKKQHFFNILNNNGFIIHQKGTPTKLNIKTLSKMKKTKEEYEKLTFTNHVEEFNKNETLKKRFEFLSVIEKQTAYKYREILQDPHKLNDYLNFIKLLKNEKTILFKIKDDIKNITEYKAVFTSYYKISLIWQLEKEMNIERFQFDKKEIDEPLKISDELIKKISVSFRCNKHPLTFNECIDFYAHKIQHITGFINIVLSEKKQINKVRKQIYNIDETILNDYLKLYELSYLEREHLIKSKYFYKKEIKEGTEKQITEINFIEDLEKMDKETIKKAFFMSYPLNCIEYTMTDNELLNIGWSKTNVNDFKHYKTL